jgi:endonuclease/exonuclease/phosphatase family metal-dependent hydrolase
VADSIERDTAEGCGWPLRVATYNIHRAIGIDRRQDTARISAVIGELQADVIGLQEVDWHHDHDDVTSQFEYLAHLSGYRAIPDPILRDHRGHYGNLLLTRLTVLEVRRMDLSEPNREPRGAIDVDLEVGGKALRIIVTHLGLGTRERRRQATRLCEAMSRRPGQPTLLLGDFNEWIPGNPTLRPLLRLCGATAIPATYPSFRPVLALDRILSCGVPRVRRVKPHTSLLARDASDHLPLLAEVEAGARAETESTDSRAGEPHQDATSGPVRSSPPCGPDCTPACAR